MANPASPPLGMSTVSPYLVVEGAQGVLAFLSAVFDATVLRRYDMPDGSVMHAEVKIGDTVIMLGEAGGEWPAFASWMHVYVQDVDATFQRALDAGGVSVQEPVQKDWDTDRRGGIKDPSGNTWWIATPVT